MSIQVEAYIQDFDTDEVFGEAADRVAHINNPRIKDTPQGVLNKKELERLVAALKEKINPFPAESLDDGIKNDHLKKIWSKYTAADFERLLP